MADSQRKTRMKKFLNPYDWSCSTYIGAYFFSRTVALMTPELKRPVIFI